jgi:hypothetical protein
MKNLYNLLLPPLLLLAIACGRQSGTSGQSTVVVHVETGECLPEEPEEPPAETPQSRPVPKRTPRPAFCLQDFQVGELQSATVNWFFQDSLEAVLAGTWMQPGRLGNIPSNLTLYGRVAFDDDHFFSLERNNTIRRIHLDSGKETTFGIPGAVSRPKLNYWKGHLYYIATAGIMRFNPKTEELDTLLPRNEGYRHIAILDDCLFYLTNPGKLAARHLETQMERTLIPGGVQGFSLTEDLLIYVNSDDELHLLALSDGQHFAGGVNLHFDVAHYDRLLFATASDRFGLNASPRPQHHSFFTIHFGNDSLVVMPHYEEMVTFFQGTPVGVSEGVGSVALGYKPGKTTRGMYGLPLFESFTIYSPGMFVDLLATSHDRMLIFYYELVSGYYYHDMLTGQTEAINEPYDFRSKDPRAITPAFEIPDDHTLLAKTSEGPITLQIKPGERWTSILEVTGAGHDTSISISYTPDLLRMAGFYKDVAVITIPGGEGGYYGHQALHSFINIVSGESVGGPRYPVETLTPFRDGFVFYSTYDDRFVTVLEASW